MGRKGIWENGVWKEGEKKELRWKNNNKEVDSYRRLFFSMTGAKKIMPKKNNWSVAIEKKETKRNLRVYDNDNYVREKRNRKGWGERMGRRTKTAGT